MRTAPTTLSAMTNPAPAPWRSAATPEPAPWGWAGMPEPAEVLCPAGCSALAFFRRVGLPLLA